LTAVCCQQAWLCRDPVPALPAGACQTAAFQDAKHPSEIAFFPAALHRWALNPVRFWAGFGALSSPSVVLAFPESACPAGGRVRGQLNCRCDENQASAYHRLELFFVQPEAFSIQPAALAEAQI
jgi:hypothetical protein